MLFGLGSCAKTPSIEGKWTVLDPFFKGTYKIIEVDNNYSAQLLRLNDGTTKYQYKKGEIQLWEFVKAPITQNEKIDGNSGATQTNNPTHQIRIITKDTIQVITKEFNQDRTYTWVKL